MHDGSSDKCTLLACQIEVPDTRNVQDKFDHIDRTNGKIAERLAEQPADLVVLPELSTIEYSREAFERLSDLADTLEGEDPSSISSPDPDWTHAANNPHMDTLKKLTKGDLLTPASVRMSLAMMEARDTKKPDNPIIC